MKNKYYKYIMDFIQEEPDYSISEYTYDKKENNKENIDKIENDWEDEFIDKYFK